MKIIFLAFTSKVYDGHGIKIERADLTRKMSCLETWVPKIEELGHEVIFFDGDNTETFFDEKNKVLHTTSSDSYDYLNEKKIGSLMLERLKCAIAWVINNRDFDYIFRIDDGSYVNPFMLESILTQIQDLDVLKGSGGGGGMFFSKKTCKRLINYQNKFKIHIEDLAIYKFLELNQDLKINHTNLLCNQYILSEKFFTIHYTNGKRQYTTDTIISHYYNNTPIDRKVVLNYNLDHLTPLKCNTWDSIWKTTPVFYSFDVDKYNWEHYGSIARSHYPVNATCPFAENSIKELLFYNVNFDFSKENEIFAFNSYVNSIKNDGFIYFFYDNNELDTNILNNLKLIKKEEEININIEYIKNFKGNFYKLKKL